MKQYLYYLAVVLIPLGLLFVLAKVLYSRKLPGPDAAAAPQKIKKTDWIPSILILAIFPFLLMIYQLAHGPRFRSPLPSWSSLFFFFWQYVFFSVGIMIIVAFLYLRIMGNRFLKQGLSSLETSVNLAGLSCCSLYIAWISAAFTSLPIMGRLWRENILWENIFDGLFGFAVGILCFMLIRFSSPKYEGRSPYLFLALLAVVLVVWNISSAKAGMPLYFKIPRILSFPGFYAVRLEDVLFRISYFLQALLSQIIIPFLVLLYFFVSIKPKRVTA